MKVFPVVTLAIIAVTLSNCTGDQPKLDKYGGWTGIKGEKTGYFHLEEINVSEGERVTQGQVLGRVGQTGRASGPHLHWGVRIHGSRVDPLSLVHIFKQE